MSLYTHFTPEESKLLANELGIDIIDLDRLNYKVYYTYSKEDVHIGYELKLIGDNPQEILDKIYALDKEKVSLPSTLFEEMEDDWYNYQYDSITDSEYSIIEFNNEIESLEKLNEIKLPKNNTQSILKRQIFIGIIGTMETYLSDTFINMAFSHQIYLEKFVRTFPEFAKRKFELRDLFDTYKTIRETATNVMLEVIYHDLLKVREMYMKTFEMDFPSIKEPMRCVKMRHDLVHRNGKTKDHEIINLDTEIIKKTFEIIKKFITDISDIVTTFDSPEERFREYNDFDDLPF